MNHHELYHFHRTMNAVARHSERVPVGLSAVEMELLTTALAIAEDALTFIETGVVTDYLQTRLEDPENTGLNKQLRSDWRALYTMLTSEHEGHPGVIASKIAWRERREALGDDAD